jgi:hypothetical protein
MSPSPPRAPPPPPPPPDPFDAAVRSARQAQTDQSLRAKGRRRTLLTSARGDTSELPTAGKTLLGQ